MKKSERPLVHTPNGDIAPEDIDNLVGTAIFVVVLFIVILFILIILF